MVVWQRPNLLVLDEPTNHLDLDMCHAIEVALQAYEGALILVSHDRHLLRNTAEELLLVDDGQVREYSQDLADYQRWILSSYQQQDTAPGGTQTDTSKKEKRQLAAARRDRLRPLQSQLAKTERDMTRVDSELAQLQTQLGENDLYSEERKNDLTTLLAREGELKQLARQLEERWLEQQLALEEITAADETG